MGRRRTVGAALLVLALSLAGCRVGGGTPAVALAELTGGAARYDGETVATEGVVQTYDEPRHYWIEDHDRNRVELVPHGPVAPLVGDRVRVTGRFSSSAAEGRRITLDTLEVIETAPRALPGVPAQPQPRPRMPAVTIQR